VDAREVDSAAGDRPGLGIGATKWGERRHRAEFVAQSQPNKPLIVGSDCLPRSDPQEWRAAIEDQWPTFGLLFLLSLGIAAVMR
jgi:hypothetical protein